jgi:hypothetical protein
MAGICEKGKRVGCKAKNDFRNDKAKIQHDPDRKRPIVIRRPVVVWVDHG